LEESRSPNFMSRDSNGGDNRQSSFAALRRFAFPRVVKQRGFLRKTRRRTAALRLTDLGLNCKTEYESFLF
jgi:hypothetical protein